MRLLQLLLVSIFFLAVLCGPAILVARNLYRRGYPLAPRCLRIIVPLQVILALGAVLLGEDLWQHQLPALLVVCTVSASALGATAMWAIGALFPSRLI